MHDHGLEREQKGEVRLTAEERSKDMRDLTVLDQLIIGRVDPHIYAFTTNTIPNYLKVGDTYRPVAVRLQEWRDHFPDLQKEYEHIAKVSDDIYFRDFAVHSFLEGARHRTRLLPTEIEQGIYYSREFFKEASALDIAEAVEDIQQDFDGNTIIVYKPVDTVTERNKSALQFLDLMTYIDKYSEIKGKELSKKLVKYVKTAGVDFSIVKKYLQFYPDKVYRNIYQVGLMGELI